MVTEQHDWMGPAATLIRRFEDWVPHPYGDSAGIISAGYGSNIATKPRFLAVPWRLDHAAGAAVPTRSVADSYDRLAAFIARESAKAHAAGRRLNITAGAYAPLTRLRLPVAIGEAMLVRDLGGGAGELRRKFPAFDRFPVPAKLALVDMIYNLGGTRFSAGRWPKLFAAVRAQDWVLAAVECQRRGIADARNQACADLFRAAAGSGRQPAGQPDIGAAAARITHDMAQDVEPIGPQQGSILSAIQAAMIERRPLELADHLAQLGPAGEEQGAAGSQQARQTGEEGALIPRPQVEQAVPQQKPVEGAGQRQGPHIRHQPALIGEAFGRAGEQGWRAIDPGEAGAASDQIEGNGLAIATADIQNLPPVRRQGLQEPVEPFPLHQAAAAQAGEGIGMGLIEPQHLIGGGDGHDGAPGGKDGASLARPAPPGQT